MCSTSSWWFVRPSSPPRKAKSSRRRIAPRRPPRSTRRKRKRSLRKGRPASAGGLPRGVCQLAEPVTEGVEFLLNLRGVLDLHGQCFIHVFDSPLQDEDFFMFGAGECARQTMNSGLSSRSRCALLASLAPDSRVALGACLTDSFVSGFP